MKTIDPVNFNPKTYKSHIDFWKSFLPTYPYGFSFQPLDVLGKDPKKAHEEIRFTLSEKSRQTLFSITQGSDTALFVCMLSVVGVLLRKYTDQPHIIINSPLLPLEDNEEQLNELIPLFLDVADTLSLRDMLNAVQETVGSCYTYQNYPLSLLDDKQKEAVFHSNLLITYNRIHEEQADPSACDLIIGLEKKQDTFSVRIAYQPQVFEAAFVQLIPGHIEQILAGFENLDTRVEAIDILTGEEKQTLLTAFNATQREFPQDKTIPQLFEAQVARTPQHTALVYKGISLTYEQLNASANRLAHFLQGEYEAKPGDVIGVLSDRSDLLITALLGTMKAGCVYLPIDAKYPDERIQHMIKDAGVKYLLVHSQYFPKLSSFYDIPMFALDFQLNSLETPSTNLEVATTAVDLAYIIYTSGSTGQPKGVMLNHQGFVNMIVDQIHVFGISPADRVVQFASASFDASLSEMFMALLQGASLVMVEQEVIQDTQAMLGYLKEKEVTVATFPPSYLTTFNLDDLRFLRVLISAGEAAHANNLAYCSQFAQVFNAYGPTECSVCVSIYPVKPTDKGQINLPIGKPIANVQVYLLDQNLALVPRGMKGDMYVAGAGLAQGYLHATELTEEKFIANPFGSGGKLYKTGDIARWSVEGNLEFLGRQDGQMKLRGYRIEPGEIASVLNQHPDVQGAYVMQGKGDELIAVVVPSQEVKVEDLNQWMGQKLPEYMIPSRIVLQDRLPLSANGKVDKKALLELIESLNQVTSNYVAPRNEMEKLVATVWQSALGLDKIGVYDSFFALGGDSIKGIQIVSRIFKAGYKATLQDLFRHPVIAEFAALVKQTTLLIDQAPVSGAVPLSPVQANFFQYNLQQPHHFNHAVMLYIEEGLAPTAVEMIFGKIQEHHDALRLRFTQEAGLVYQENADTQLPLAIDRHDLRSWNEQAEGMSAVAKLEALAAELQGSIDLEKGPLMKIGHYHLADGDRVLIVVHHLAVDTVSWRILSEDIESLYQQYKNGETLSLPLKTHAFKAWSEGLSAYAQSDAFQKEIPYWQQVAAVEPTAIPKDLDGGNSLKDTAALSFALSKEATQQLLTKVNDAFHTEINDVLLTALALAYQQAFGKNKLSLTLEGHGREDILPDFNNSRTVGWFTSMYPIVLHVNNQQDLGRQLKEVKESLRQIPNKGIGYQIWKYLAADEYRKDLPISHEPQISFNYLGQFDTDIAELSFDLAKESYGFTQDPEDIRLGELEFSGMITHNQLSINVAYGSKQFLPETIASFLKHYENALLSLIQFCASKEKAEFTPSDFTFQGLSIDLVDQLTATYALEDVYPLSPMQEGMLFQGILNQASSSYFDQTSYRIHGQLNPTFVEKSLNNLLERHAVLRTVFVHDLPGRPVQIVLKDKKARFRFEDIRHLGDAAAIDQYIQEFKHESLNNTLNFEENILFQVAMLQVGEAEFEFIWSYHHILMDGWCIRILVAEFTELYSSYHEGRTTQLLPVQPYSTFIHWLERQDQETAKEFWTQYLADYSATAVVPRMKALPTQTHDGSKKQLFVKFDKTRTHRLTSLAGDNQVTVNTIVQAIWGVLLSKYNHRNDVVFGTVVSGRPSQIVGVESMVGLFINAVPVRIRYQAEDSFTTLLKESQAKAVNGEAYHYYPLAEVQAQSVLKQGLIDHLLTFENYPVAEEIEGLIQENQQQGNGVELEISNVDVHDENHYDFNILFALSAELTLKLEYTQVYETAFIEGVARHFSHIVDQILDNPEVNIGSLTMPTADERKQLLEEFSSAKTAYPRSSTIQQLFEEQAAATPTATAVVFEGVSLTYQQLNDKANALANYLREKHQIQPNEWVGLLADRSEAFIVSLLAILKAGAGYAPLDPAYPKERIRLMLEDIRPKILLTQSDYLFDIDYYQGELFALDVQLDALGQVADNPNPINQATDQAYVMYTSGSTGVPKGVVVTHRNVVRLVRNTNYIDLHAGLKLIQTGALSFDACTFEIWGMLLNGGELHLLPQQKLMDIHALKAAMLDRDITTMWFTSSWFNQLLDLDVTMFSQLKHLLVGGEKLSPEHINRVRRAYPNLKVINGYGPTENTTFSICYVIDADYETSIPLGKPIANTSVYIVDENGQPVPVGIEGEIYLGGDGLAKGYLNQEALTAEKFIAHPFVPGEVVYRTGDMGKWLPDGKVEYVGRRDEQVKVRGYRIEAGEIAHVVKQHPAVQDVSIQVVKDETGDASLVGVLIPTLETAYTVKQLAALKEQNADLSTLMLPNRMVVAQNNRSETEFLFKEIFEDHTYNKHGVEVKSGDVIFDVGANIGMFSLYLGLHYPGTKMYSFEPVKPTFETLSANAALYPVNIHPIHCGLSNEDQTVRFAHYPYNTVMSGRYASDKSIDKDILVGYFNKQQEDEKEKVTTAQISEMLEERMQVEYYDCRLRRLSDVIREEGVERIDLLKVDVEKSELDVLLGIDEADWAKIRQVSMEIHDIDGTLQKIVDLMERHGFSYYVEQEDMLEETHLYNIYATKNGIAAKNVHTLPPDLAFDIPGRWTTAEGLTQSLKAHCELSLPSYMVPTDFYVVNHFPLTEHGKVDVKKLLSLSSLHAQKTEGFVAATDEIEQTLVEIWEEVLGKEGIGVRTNFFEIGGHSLKAIQVVSHIAKRLNTKLELGSIFATPTIAELAEEIRGSANEAYQSIPTLEEAPYYDLSFAQRRLWVTCQFEKENIAYNMPGAIRLKGVLNVEAFERAFAAVIDRHESLRTTFCQVEGEPKQKIHSREALGIKLKYEDLKGLANQDALVKAQVEAEASAHFDLEEGPLVRAKLLELEADSYVLLFMMHHIISDGRSLEVLINDFLTAYAAFSQAMENPLPPLRIQYKDFAAWHNQQVTGDKLKKHRQYWKEQLGGELPVLALPTDFPRPAIKTNNGNMVAFGMDKIVSAGLFNLAQESSSSLFIVIQATFKALLFHYTKQDDIIIGSPITGREHLDLNDQIGYFLNTLALRTRFDGADTFATLLNKVKADTHKAYQHQLYPFDLLLNDLNLKRDPSRSILFDVGFNLNREDEALTEQNHAFKALDISNLSMDFGTVKTDLWLNAFEEKEYVGFSLEYNTDLFNVAFIEAFISDYQFLLTKVVESPKIPLKELTAFIDAHHEQCLKSKQAAAASSNLAQLLNLGASGKF
ncbi:MAG: amino acid adenylation domain-containing protein [Bacteroidota bacterium]